MTGKWDHYLSALAHARQQRDFQRAKAAPWFLLAIFVFLAVWFSFGIQIAMVAMFFCAFLFIYFNSKVFSGRLKVLNNSEATATNVEQQFLQKVTEDVAPWLKFRLDLSPGTAAVTSSQLIRSKVDFVHGSRGLIGAVEGGMPITATYIQAGQFVHIKNSDGVVKKHQTIIYQGLFVSMTFPRAKKGWVVLESDNLESLGWMAHEWRSARTTGYVRLDNPDFEKHFHVVASSQQEGFEALSSHVLEALVEFAKQQPGLPITITFREGKMMALLPMKQNPFELRNNEALWESEIARFSNVAQAIGCLCESLNSEKLKREISA